jgi:hypothetical protein
MLQSLGYEDETGFLIAYHVGIIGKAQAGGSASKLADAVRTHDPSAVMFALDHARWDVEIEHWIELVTQAMEIIGDRPMAVLSPVALPTDQADATKRIAQSKGVKTAMFDNEAKARSWLQDTINKRL